MTQAFHVMVRDSLRDVRRNPMAWLAPLGILTGTFAALLAFTAVVESALLRSVDVDAPGRLQIITAVDPGTGLPVTFPIEVLETVATQITAYSALSLYRVGALRLTYQGQRGTSGSNSSRRRT